MTFLPVVVRELRVTARNWKTYWQRVSVTLLAGAACALLVLWSQTAMPGVRSNTIFAGLTQLWFYYGVLSGGVLSADSLSRETREGTLGLLFLTPLKGYDVVLGKLAATALLSVYSLLAIFPVLAIPILLGGVTAGEFCRTMLALLNSLFFAHALALLISAYNREAQKSISQTIASVWLLIILLPNVDRLAAVYGSELWRLCSWVSPRLAFLHATPQATLSPSASAANAFWPALLLSHGVAWLFLAWTSWRVRDCWREKPVGAWRLRRGEWHQWWLYGSARCRAARRKDALPLNPFYWLLRRRRFTQLGLWLVLGLSSLVGMGISVLAHQGRLAPAKGELIFAVISLHLIVKVSAASAISGDFYRQRSAGELEMLLGLTPLSVAEIMRGAWMNIRMTYRGPVAAILGLDGLLLVLGCLGADGRNDPAAEAAFVFGLLAMMVFLVADLWAIGWVAIWAGMTARKPTEGTGRTIGRVLLLPWLIAAIFSVLMVRSEAYGVAFWVLGIAACGLSDWLWAINSRQKILEEFRLRAMSHADQPLTLLGRLGRFLGTAWARRAPFA